MTPTQPAEGLPELPELPEPQKECWIGHELFSADQMHAYAREAIATVARERDELREALNYAFERLDEGDAEEARLTLFGYYDARAALGGDGGMD